MWIVCASLWIAVPQRLALTLPYWPDQVDVQQLIPLLTPTPVAQTGQSLCFDSSGNVISCAGTGQDGELQAGEPWVNPRFSDLNDGTIRDEMTQLVWLKNANCNGSLTWAQAIQLCADLADGMCGLTDGSLAGDWRMPNRFEMQSLQALAYGNPPLCDRLGTGHWVEGDAFSQVQLTVYWTSSNAMYNPLFCWVVDFSNGGVAGFDKSASLPVWPVRGP
ncbi:MAG: DUF1566 domain-containing protein [Acidobacteria bacterium]|nr:DUF1566 domain-containing protein [Acidobacteriota bacterium]MCB9397200.1 DUF1566 domain-containing protein [Acidobacteriota bacterium]